MGADRGITADQVIAALRAREADLRATGIRRLTLFGSVARGEARSDSDIALVAALDPAAKMELVGLVALEQSLGDLFGREPHISSEPIRKPRLRGDVDRDSIRAF